MDTNPPHGGIPPAFYEPPDDVTHLDAGIAPVGEDGGHLHHVSGAETAKFAQIGQMLVGAFHMAAVSDVFVLLQKASDKEGVDAAVAAIPDMSPRERLVLLNAIIHSLVENDPMTSGLDSTALSSAMEDAWISLSAEENVDRQNEGKQAYLLGKSVLSTHQFLFDVKTDLPPLLEKINDLPVRYRPKILAALSDGVRFVGTSRGYQSGSPALDRRRAVFDADFQLLLDQSDGLDRPVSLPTVSAMAVVMLLNPASTNVQEALCQRFGISTPAEQDRFEAGVVAELALRFPYHPLPLDPLFSRWSEESDGIRRLTHEALSLQRVGRSEQQRDGSVLWDTATFPVRQLAAASESAIGVPEDAIPAFSGLGPTAMRFWELAWSGERAFPDPKDQLGAILESPWQLQPTLLTTLMQRPDVRELSKIGFDIATWSSQVADQCVNAEHFTAALRALLLPFVHASTCFTTSVTESDSDEAVRNMRQSLRSAWEVAVEHIPSSHWGPLIDAMAQIAPRASEAGEWPQEKDVLSAMHAFVRNPESFNVIPMGEAYMQGYFGKSWESIPDQASGTLSQFEVFCERLNIVPEWRDDIRNEIQTAIEEKILGGQLSEEEAAIHLVGLFAVD